MKSKMYIIQFLRHLKRPFTNTLACFITTLIIVKVTIPIFIPSDKQVPKTWWNNNCQAAVVDPNYKMGRK